MALLDSANHVPVTMAELVEALATESLIQLRLEVDLDDYEELLIHRRGSHEDTVQVPRWWGLRAERKTITVDERVVVFTRVKPDRWFAAKDTDPADRNLVPGAFSLKQFRNVPRADIEMLLPSTRVRFRTIDSLALGVPALASGIAVLVTKLLPTLGLMFLLIGAWLQRSCDRSVDFEVDDAVDKLRRLDLVHGDTTLRARPVSEALVELDRRWDDLFTVEAPDAT